MQKGFANFLLIVILVAAILSVFGVYWISSKNQTSVTIQDKRIPSPASNKPQNTVYKNSGIGLEFSLPPGYTVKEESEKEYFKRVYGDTRKNFTFYVQYPPPEFVNSFYVLKNGESNLDQANLIISVFKNPENLDAVKFYKEYWYYPFVWGDFSAEKNKIAPVNIELIAGREGKSGVVDYREGKPKFIYLPRGDKGLMLQIQMSSQDNEMGKKILDSFKFE